MPIDFPSSAEIEAVILQLPKKDCRAFAAAFRERRGGEHDEGWALLSQIFDIHLQHSNASEPFGPMVVMDGKRSMIPDDLTDEQLDALRPTLDAIVTPEYRARVGDAIWTRRKDAAAGRIAVEAYLESGMQSEDPDQWVACMVAL